MMGHKLVNGVLAILLVVSVSACAANAGSIPEASVYNSQEIAQVIPIPTWEQVNGDGFGDVKELEVSALEAFNSYLYAGTYNLIDPLQVYDGARIFRSPDGVTWTAVTGPGFQNPHDSAPPAILDFVVFGTRLYASTGRGGNPAQIWRSSNGTSWAPMVSAGFGDPDIHDIAALAVFNNVIYAGAGSQVSGAKIYRSSTGDSNTWTLVTPAAATMAGAGVTGFEVFNTTLYATVESEAPLQIWRSSNGSTWTVAVSNGFGDSQTTSTGGMAVFGGYLYVGAGNTTAGAQLWRSNNGTSWVEAIPPGFGDPNNKTVEMVFVFQNQLYVGVQNDQTGIEIWRSADGTNWEQVNADGFGDSKNTTTNGSHAAADYLSQLYVGTSNIVTGAELWRMRQQVPATPTPTSTATDTATPTVTNTPTDTPTNPPTATATDTATSTSTATPTDTPTNTATSTPTSTPVNTPTYTLTSTATGTPTNTPASGPTSTATSTPTNTPFNTPTFTATSTATGTSTNTPTSTPTPTPISSTPGKVTGGGTIGRDSFKATFGFTLQYKQGDQEPKGNLTYQDHTSGLRLKATSFDLLVIDGDHVWITGSGILNNGQIAEFEIAIDVLSNPDRPDILYISIPGLDGYTAGGELTGGNITIH